MGVEQVFALARQRRDVLRAVTIHDRLERDKTLAGEVAPDGRAGIARGNVCGRYDSERADGRQRSDV